MRPGLRPRSFVIAQDQVPRPVEGGLRAPTVDHLQIDPRELDRRLFIDAFGLVVDVGEDLFELFLFGFRQQRRFRVARFAGAGFRGHDRGAFFGRHADLRPRGQRRPRRRRQQAERQTGRHTNAPQGPHHPHRKTSRSQFKRRTLLRKRACL